MRIIEKQPSEHPAAGKTQMNLVPSLAKRPKKPKRPKH